MPKCNICEFASERREDWDWSMRAGHDIDCPKCESASIDTSDWLAADPAYEYGANNTKVARAEAQRPTGREASEVPQVQNEREEIFVPDGPDDYPWERQIHDIIESLEDERIALAMEALGMQWPGVDERGEPALVYPTREHVRMVARRMLADAAKRGADGWTSGNGFVLILHNQRLGIWFAPTGGDTFGEDRPLYPYYMPPAEAAVAAKGGSDG